MPLLMSSVLKEEQRRMGVSTPVRASVWGKDKEDRSYARVVCSGRKDTERLILC